MHGEKKQGVRLSKERAEEASNNIYMGVVVGFAVKKQELVLKHHFLFLQTCLDEEIIYY